MKEVELRFWSQYVVDLLGVLRDIQSHTFLYILDIVADKERISSCFCNPLAVALVEGCKVADRNSHFQSLALSRLQEGSLGEGFQLLCRFLYCSLWCCDIYLCHLLSADLSCVLYTDGNDDIVAALLRRQLTELECGVAQTVAERIGNILLLTLAQKIFTFLTT